MNTSWIERTLGIINSFSDTHYTLEQCEDWNHIPNPLLLVAELKRRGYLVENHRGYADIYDPIAKYHCVEITYETYVADKYQPDIPPNGFYFSNTGKHVLHPTKALEIIVALTVHHQPYTYFTRRKHRDHIICSWNGLSVEAGQQMAKSIELLGGSCIVYENDSGTVNLHVFTEYSFYDNERLQINAPKKEEKKTYRIALTEHQVHLIKTTLLKEYIPPTTLSPQDSIALASAISMLATLG